MAISTSSTWIRGKCIGKGSFGTVSLGFDKLSGRVFAVKSVELNSGLPQQIESLENEIRILESLDYSPYVVQYLGDDRTASHRNLHVELLPGGTVTDAALQRFGGKFGAEEERIVRCHTRCMVSALQHIHSRGIVHCDVKGRNVLLGHDGSIAKLADFGSAVRMESSLSKIVPRGSPLWMAPEVVRGEYQGPESDVWALGCTVIEMVTGKPAWEDRGADTLSRIGFSVELPQLPAQLSAQGKDFLLKCLNRDRNKRWTCDQLLQHPFVEPETRDAAASSKSDDSSPRCVLDWVNSEFDEDSEEEDQSDVMSLSSSSNTDEHARGRLSKLCSGGGANWESDGWMAVRNSWTREAEESCCCGEYEWAADHQEREAAGIRSQFCETSGAEREIREECSNCGGGVVVQGGVGCGGGAGSSCQDGPEEVYLAVEETEWINFFYSLCNSLFWKHFLLTMFYRNNNYKMKVIYISCTCLVFSLISLYCTVLFCCCLII